MKKPSMTEKERNTAGIPANMKVFNLVAFRIFDQLYEAFPIPIEITPRSLSSEIIAADFPPDEAFDSIAIADNTLRWLEAEGFLRHSSSSFEGGIFYQVQLTLKGLAILDSVPVALGQNGVPEAMIKKIRRVLSAGAETMDEDAMKLLLDEVLRMVFQANG